MALDEIGAPARRVAPGSAAPAAPGRAPGADGSQLLSPGLMADAIGDSNRDCVSKSNSIK